LLQRARLLRSTFHCAPRFEGLQSLQVITAIASAPVYAVTCGDPVVVRVDQGVQVDALPLSGGHDLESELPGVGQA
jgi:hypothetical protein